MNFHHSDHKSLSTALAGSPVTVFHQDRNGQFKWFENRQSIWLLDDIAQHTEADIFTASSVQALADAKRRAIGHGGPETVELMAKREMSGAVADCFLKVVVRPSFDRNGLPDGYLCSSIDISQEKHREKTLQTLLMEVAHRSKNMLAMVLSIASQTARTSPSVEAFVRAFNGRVQSLAKSQDAVTERDWSGAKFSDLVKVQVINVVPEESSQISMTGDDLELLPSAAVHVGLALHELVTNALVSGALLQADGRSELSCDLSLNADKSGIATMTWRETPGLGQEPASPHAPVQGFGRTLLERVVPAAVGGEGSLKLSTDAVVYTLTMSDSCFRA